MRTAKTNLKKQSQFAGEQIGVNSFLKGNYGKIPLCGAQENKAKQTQSQLARSTAVGLKKQFEKTNPIFERAK